MKFLRLKIDLSCYEHSNNPVWQCRFIAFPTRAYKRGKTDEVMIRGEEVKLNIPACVGVQYKLGSLSSKPPSELNNLWNSSNCIR